MSQNLPWDNTVLTSTCVQGHDSTRSNQNPHVGKASALKRLMPHARGPATECERSRNSSMSLMSEFANAHFAFVRVGYRRLSTGSTGYLQDEDLAIPTDYLPLSRRLGFIPKSVRIRDRIRRKLEPFII